MISKTKNSNINVTNADFVSTEHKFPYIWKLQDLEQVKKNGCSVFSFFSCGGGSSMGYKLAGYEVIGNCEIDKSVNDVYVKNNYPKYNYRMDIRDFLNISNDELPEELKNLDILDGSPPCSTFSSAGDREKSWGKKKKFREGQAAQTLDDLFFYYIKAVDKLRPKIYVAENVKGILAGNAKGYINQIVKELDEIGYTCQIFLLNAASMGVPQRRERVFFVGYKKELNYPKLKLSFNEKPILYGDFADDGGTLINESTMQYRRWRQRSGKDRCVSDTTVRVEHGKISGFNHIYVKMNEVPQTQTASVRFLRFDKPRYISDHDVTLIQSFPEDYDYCGTDAAYICGMSVPPVMMANIASEIYGQWLKREK